MTRSGSARRWDPLRPLDLLTSLWSVAAVTPVTGSASAAYRTLFLTARRLVVGRRVGVRLDDRELTLTVTEFDSRLDLRALSAGQIGNVHLAARDIRWGDATFERATAVLRNVHVTASTQPELVAAPVELTVQVPAPVLDDLFAWAAPRYRAHVGPDGVARIRLNRRPGLGHVEIDTRLDGSTLWLTPSAVTVGRRRWALPARVPSYPVQLPELPHGLELTGIGFEPHLLCLQGTLPQWRMPVSRARPEDILGQLGAMGVTLNPTRLLR
ncbi:hypothetical protein [Mycolicibacterium brisbanense]